MLTQTHKLLPFNLIHSQHTHIFQCFGFSYPMFILGINNESSWYVPWIFVQCNLYDHSLHASAPNLRRDFLKSFGFRRQVNIKHVWVLYCKQRKNTNKLYWRIYIWVQDLNWQWIYINTYKHKGSCLECIFLWQWRFHNKWIFSSANMFSWMVCNFNTLEKFPKSQYLKYCKILAKFW